MSSSRFDPKTVTANWGFPNQIRVGPGRLSELPRLCVEFGMAKPLLVTDTGLASHPMITDALAALRTAGFDVGLYANVGGNPVERHVIGGVDAFRKGGHDGVIAFGGGSALDAGKAIALMVGQDRPIWDFEDIGDYWKRVKTEGIAPVIAIPTTAGTGSEVGRAAVVTDERNSRKVIVFHPRMLPVAVILDPEVTMGLPAHITAATGLDAFVHCFEAWSAPGFHPMADGLALQGMRLIADALPRAYAAGDDLEARTMMLSAASMGAMAFQKGLGAVHAIAHAIGALYHTHHGLTNAVLLPYVVRFNRSAIEARIEPVAQALGVKGASFQSVLDWILDFRSRLGIPHTLAAMDVPVDRVADVGRLAAGDPSAGGNPVPVAARDLERLFQDAVEGRL